MSEFTLIERYFKKQLVHRSDVIRGIGDDCALLDIPEGKSLAVTMDTLISGVHFHETTAAEDIGYKALAVNLSDLAAAGAEPAWVTLSITMPEENNEWLEQFMQGFTALAEKYHVQLVGGDTTRGALSITIQAHGFVGMNEAMHRHGAHVGDNVYVSGTLGDAGLGLLATLNNESEPRYCVLRLNRPTPRIELGMALAGKASSCIDVSDGLIQDLNHICKASNCGATIFAEQIPLSVKLKNAIDLDEAQKLALTAGDDYELCFTADPELEKELVNIASDLNISITKIGHIEHGNSVTVVDANDNPLSFDESGFQHF